MVDPSCIRVAVEARVADHLENKPEGVHVSKIAKKTNLHADKLGRILRLLATKHCFREGWAGKPLQVLILTSNLNTS
jgi:hypothetical protein